MANENVVIISDSTFENEVNSSEMPVLVDFYADWCGPCKMLAPTIDELAIEYAGKAKVTKINVDDNPASAQKFGVSTIPTLVFFKNGEQVDKIVGVVGMDDLTEKLDSLL